MFLFIIPLYLAEEVGADPTYPVLETGAFSRYATPRFSFLKLNPTFDVSSININQNKLL